MKRHLKSLLPCLVIVGFLFGCQTMDVPDNKAASAALLEAEALSSSGWQKIWKNQFQEAYGDFVRALYLKPGIRSATIGSALINYIRAKEFTAADLLLTTAMEQPTDPLSVAILTFLEEEIPFRKGFKEKLLQHYNELAGNPGYPYWIRRFAMDKMVSYAMRFSQDMKALEKWSPRLHALQEWTILGPFDNVSHAAILRDVDVEREPYSLLVDSSHDHCSGKNNQEIQSFRVDPDYYARDGWVYLSQYLNFPDESAVFARSKITVEEDTERLFILSRKGALRFWIDDELLLADPAYKSGTDLHWLKVKLSRGEHTLVVELANQYADLAFRLTMHDLSEVGDADSCSAWITPENFPAFNAFPMDPLYCALAENLVTEPAGGEHYFWTAWLANQRGDGDSALKLALAGAEQVSAPGEDSPLILEYLKAVSFLNNGNYIDARNLLISICEKGHIFAPAANFVIRDYINHHHPDKAERLIGRMKNVNNSWYYALENELLLLLDYDDQEKAEVKISKLVEEYNYLYSDAPGLFSSFLDNYSDHSGVTFQKKNFYARLRELGMPLAADIGEMQTAFADDKYSQAAARAADVLLFLPYHMDAHETLLLSRARQGGQFDSIRSQAEKIMESYPRDTIIPEWNATISREMVSWFKVLRRSNNPRYDMGKVDKIIKDEKSTLIKMYRKLINLQPWRYSLRVQLRRELQQKALTPLLEFSDLDRIITEFEEKKQEWDGDAVIVLDEVTELFFGSGASRRHGYYILKVLSENGVISESTQSLPVYSHFSELEVLQAFLLKPDGSTVDAQRRGNLLSFRGLKSGDYIIYQYAENHYEPGSLNNHYWTSFRLNSFYPVNEVRYRLLRPAELEISLARHIPEGIEVNITEENFDADYKLHTITSKDLACVAYESHLPDSQDLFAWVDISTLQEWTPVIDWYAGLSGGQTRVTYKVAAKTAELIDGLEKRRDKLKVIYDFVSQKIKYEDLNFQYSAYKPQQAEKVLADGFGDCKDKAILLISMLKAAGIEAYIALNTPTFTGKNYYLPSPRFIHTIVVVPAEEGEEEMILDPTSEYLTYPDLPSGSIGSPYLPITPDSPGLVRIAEPATRGKTLMLTKLKKEGNSNFIEGTILFNNNRSGEARATLFTSNQDFKATLFSRMFTYSVPGFQLDSIHYDNIYTLQEDPRIEFRANLPDPLRQYNNRLVVLELPWMIGLPAQVIPALSEGERKSNFNFKYERFADPLCQTINYTIPSQYRVLSIPDDFVYNFPGKGYIKYTFTLSGRELVADREFYFPFMEIAPEQLDQIKEALLLSLQKEEEKIILSK